MKPAMLAQKLGPVLPILQCTICGTAFHTTPQSLLCERGHCFDLSKHGYVNVAPGRDQSAEKYTAPLFESRRLVLDAGFYAPVLEAVCASLHADRPFALADVGCGEGYYARCLAGRFADAHIIGVDLSRDAVTAAARVPSAAQWLVADLKHLPFADASLDVVLDVLTPADYVEFARVLKADGLLIKVIPGSDYLCEMRSAVAPWLRSGDEYDNARVIAHMKENADILSETELRRTFPLTPELSAAFLHMSPMTFNVNEENLRDITLSQITLHMHVFVCRMKR